MLKKGKIYIPLFSITSHQRFVYKPLYYDPEKDKKAKKSKFTSENSDLQIYNKATFKIKGNRIKGSFKSRNDNSASQKIRVLLISAILVIISLFILNKINAIFAVLLTGIFILFYIYKSKKI